MPIGKLNIELRVNTNSSCKTLVIADYSTYLETPESPRIQIQLPGASTWHTFAFTASQTNTFNSDSFLDSDEEEEELTNLADGLYTIKYGFCPYEETSTTFYHVRQCLTWCRWHALLKQSFDSCLDLSKEMESLLNRIEYLMIGAEIYAKDCEPEKAIEFHQKAVELLDHLECIIL